MAVPKHRVSKTRGRTHRANLALTEKEVVTCPSCGAVIRTHRVCKACGSYKGKKVVTEKENA